MRSGIKLYIFIIGVIFITFGSASGQVLPYQRGTGQLLAGGSIDWATGEAVLSLCWAALYVPLGIVTYKVIRDAYAMGAKRRSSQRLAKPPPL